MWYRGISVVQYSNQGVGQIYKNALTNSNGMAGRKMAIAGCEREAGDGWTGMAMARRGRAGGDGWSWDDYGKS